MRRNHAYLWGLLLVLIGAVLLLRETGAITENVRIWPIVLMVLAGWLLLDRLGFGGALGGGFVWPLLLLAVGGVFFLQDIDVINADVALWPVVLIAIGLGIVLSAIPGRRGFAPTTSETVPLSGATSGRVVVNHGAGRLRIGSTDAPDRFLEGTFVGGAEVKVRRDGDRVEAELRQSIHGGAQYLFPWNWSQGRPMDWDVSLGRGVPLALELKAGANDATVDLSELTVTDLRVDTGASKTELTTPRAGRTAARIKTGASTVRVRVPEGVAGRIKVSAGLTTVKVDETRFPRSGDRFASPGFDDAENRVDLEIDAGAANVEVS